MYNLSMSLEGNIIPLSGKGSRVINKMLEEKILPIVMKEVTVDIADKAEEYARGIDQVLQGKVSGQSTRRIGDSISEYKLTEKMADSINVEPTSKTSSLITVGASYAPYVEFGTWGGTSPGQAPNPFLRGGYWFVAANLSPTIDKIQSKIGSKS